MPSNALVKIHFGPYDQSGVVMHSRHRLQGLETVLTEGGHQVEFVEIPDRNTVELWVNGQQVFQCGITELDFGGDGQLDSLCKEALLNVQHAF